MSGSAGPVVFIPTIGNLIIPATRCGLSTVMPIATGTMALFYATDLGILYLDAIGTWTPVGGSGSGGFILNQVSAGQIGGFDVTQTVNGGANAFTGQIIINNSGTGTGGILQALVASAVDNGTGQLNRIQGFKFQLTKASGSVSSVAPDSAGVFNIACNSNISTIYGIDIIGSGAAGNILTNFYGIRVDLITAGGLVVTNPNAFASAAGYLHGFGTLAPSQTIHNTGGASAVPGALALAAGLNSNINPANTVPQRITGPGAVFSVGGFTGGTDGEEMELFNTVAFAMTIVNEDVASTAANRIHTLTGANVTLRAGTSYASLRYYATDQRWILRSTN